jgi:TonB-linked SusC/RagA family outer membrane protein
MKKIKPFHECDFSCLTKTFRIMRITVFLMLAVILQTFANEAYSQKTKLSLDYTNTRLEVVLDDIEELSEFFFLANEKLVNLDRSVNLSVKNKKIDEILDMLFAGTDVVYTITDRKIILAPSFLTEDAQQQRAISGKVTDSGGQPLPGVTVVVKGTTQGTVTNADGDYTLANIPEDATLVFSFVGMRTQEVVVGSQTTISVKMEEETIGLEEVVAVGYRTQARGTVTGSISDVQGEEFRNIPAESLSSTLSGRLSGVSVEPSAGTPGMESNIRIRAIGTFNDAEPLYVIDGIVAEKYAFEVLSSNEIESISILKDGASASIYGSRAANGVILVTTRRGSTGAPTVTFRSTIATQKPAREREKLSAFESATIINQALAYHYYYNDGLIVPENDSRLFAPDELEYFKENEWNWLEEMWQTPYTTQQTIDVSGGTDIIKYFVSGNFNYASGFLENIDYRKINLRSNVDVNLTKNLKLSFDINNDSRNTWGPAWKYNRGSWGQGNLIGNLWGRNKMTPPSINGLPVGNWVEWSPYAIVDRDLTGYEDTEWSGINWTLSLDYQIPFIDGLGVNVKYNEYRLDELQKYFQVPYDMTVFNTLGSHNHIIGDEPVGLRRRDDGEHMYNRNEKSKKYQFNAQLNYKKSFGEHNLDALLVYEQTESFEKWMQALRYDFISPTIDQFVGGSEENQEATGGEFESARLSYVGAVNYNYDNRYLLQGSFRYDGSIIFAPENRWGFFPSGSFGWRISEESFFNSDFIDNLMIRGSVGLLGNDAVGQYQWSQSYRLDKGAAFNSVSKGLEPGTIANEDITWEKSLSYNFGFDSRFWGNKMDLKVELFYRHTYDILGRKYQSIPSTFGASLPDENYQEIDSKGFEIELGYENSTSSSSPISYRIRGNIGYAVNEVMVMDEAENIRPYQSQLGRPLGGIFGYLATDILRTQDDIDALPEGYTINGETPRLGMLNYKDIRGPNSDEPDGRITSDDQEWLKDYTIPPMNYGLSLGASWKSINIDALFNGFAGHYTTKGTNLDARRESLPDAYWADAWFIDNIDADYPAAQKYGWPPTRYPRSDWWLVNKSYLRLKNLNISYDLPQTILSLNSIRIFYNGANLFFLFDHMKDLGIDPEMTSSGNYPLMRTHTFGLNIIL